MIAFFKNLIPAFIAAKRLDRLWKSTTTTSQLPAVAGMGLVGSLIASYLATLWPALITEEVQLGIVTVVAALSSPLVSRVIAFARKGDVSGFALDPGSFVVRVRTNSKTSWIRYNYTLLDAHQEGWDECVVVTDVDLGSTGATFRARKYDLKKHAVGEEFPLSDVDDKWLRNLVASGATVPDLDKP